MGAREVRVEILGPDGWVPVGGSIPEFMPPGSMSTAGPTGRDVFMFGWYEGDGPAVWRSVGGVDIETSAVRAIMTSQIEKVADLEEGPYELTRHGETGPMQVRLSVVPGR